MPTGSTPNEVRSLWQEKENGHKMNCTQLNKWCSSLSSFHAVTYLMSTTSLTLTPHPHPSPSPLTLLTYVLLPHSLPSPLTLIPHRHSHHHPHSLPSLLALTPHSHSSPSLPSSPSLLALTPHLHSSSSPLLPLFAGKFLLMLQAIRRAHAIDRDRPELHEHIVDFCCRGNCQH